MEKKLYWLVESNGDLSVTIKDISRAEEIILADFDVETDDGKYEIDDLQYTVTPVMMTEEEFNNLPEQS
jgi:hypothetical protein